ncbi:hypothetical protein FA13DRAFT_1648645, partial [Coprinellus micaceus]
MTTSPFEAILGTNHIPSERDCKLIQEYVNQEEQTLTTYRERADELQLSLQALLEKIDATRSSINVHRTIISLSRRIPDDVLREIFIQCLPQNHDATLCPSDPPILLTNICQRWRRVARSTPRLWSSIH